MVTYNDKILVPNATKDGLDTIHPETNTGNVYDFKNDKWLDELLDIATIDKLGLIKPDGNTIKVDPITGVASAQEQGYQLTDVEGLAKDATGIDLNTLTETGIYQNKGGQLSLNYPVEFSDSYSAIVYVQKLSDNWIYQRWEYFTPSTVEIYSRGYVLNSWGNWRKVTTNLNNTLTSSSTTEAATANAVRTLNVEKASKAIQRIGLVPQNGWTMIAECIKDDIGMVTVMLDAVAGTTTRNTVITTLPVGMRPSKSYIVPVVTLTGVTDTSAPPSALYLMTNGEIRLNFSNTKSVLLGNFTFPTV